jgi:O-antigen ligase
MIKAIVDNKRMLIYLAVWMAAGILSKQLGFVVTLLFFLGFKKTDWKTMLLIGLWFTLIISDNGKGMNFTKSVKPIVMVLAFIFMKTNGSVGSFKSNWSKFFIPFFVLCSFFWLRSPEPIDSLQKTISFILLFITVPTLLIQAYIQEGNNALKTLVWFGVLLLTTTLALSVVNPGGFYYSGRYCGIFRNPNGLGVFVSLFYFLFRTIKDVFPHMFDKKDVWIITAICIVSIVLCGSRGGLLAVIIFLVFNQFYKISPFIGFFVLILSVLLSNYAISQLPVIVTSLGLEEYFRLETLEDGSGRFVAWDFAMQQIKESPYLGRGMGYTDWVFQDNMIELNLLGHQGNAHNTYLTYWIDTGLFGLISFLSALLIVFVKSSFQSRVALPICYAILFMINVESWLIASLNPFTIILVMILTLLWHKKDILLNEEKKEAIALKEMSSELETSS